MKSKLINVCAYCRVSTKKEEQQQSFKAQNDFFSKELNEEKGFNLVGIYADEGLSGTKFKKRPQFNKMLYDAGLDMVENSSNFMESRNSFKSVDYVLTDRKPKFKYIYVKDSSRFARNLEVVRILNRLREKGVYVYFMDLNKSTEDTTEQMLINFMFTMAEQESRDRSNKVRFGKQRSTENGKIRIGAGIYGYNANYKENTLTINPEEAEAVKKMFNWRIEGLGCRKIAALLEKENITTRKGSKWNPTTILYILKNPIYMGKQVSNKTYTNSIGDGSNTKVLPIKNWKIEDTDKVEAIITEDTFRQVKKIIERNAGKSRGVYNGATIYAGKIICGKCGHTYRIHSTKTKKGKKINYFNCVNKIDRGTCNNPNVSEKVVTEALEPFLKPNAYRDLVGNYIEILKKAIVTKKANNIINSVIADTGDLKAKLEAEKSKLSKLLDLMLMEDTEEIKAVFADKSKAIKKNIMDLEEKINMANTETTLVRQKNKNLSEAEKELTYYYKKILKKDTAIKNEEFIKDHLIKIVVDPEKNMTICTRAEELVLKALKNIGLEDSEIDELLDDIA